MEREGEVLLHHFWLVTSYSWEEKPGSDLLEHYRKRGAAEGSMGELMTVLAPALSSSPRQKTHYRDEIPTDLTSPCNSFAHNETLLLLNAIAYNVLHVGRVLIERVTGEGWSLGRFRERLLRVASRMVLHSRRAVLIFEQTAVELWNGLWKQSITTGKAGGLCAGAPQRGLAILPPSVVMRSLYIESNIVSVRSLGRGAVDLLGQGAVGQPRRRMG
jgi:hypothetical protein